jgi:allantoinase
VQSTLAVLLDRGHHQRQLPLERIASLMAATPARRFKIEGKGQLAVGFDADIVLVNAGESFTLDAADLQQRHKTSPYVGQTFRGRVKRTIRRGESIFVDGRIVGNSTGRFVRPAF